MVNLQLSMVDYQSPMTNDHYLMYSDFSDFNELTGFTDN